MKRRLFLILLVLSMTFGAPVALAQDVTDTVEPAPTAVVTLVATEAPPPDESAEPDVNPVPPSQNVLEAALALIIKGLADATFLPFAAGFTVVVTAILKKLIPANVIGAGGIALTVQVIVWVLWTLALHFGYSELFQTWVDTLTTVLPAIAAMFGATLLAAKGYEKAVDKNVPLFGDKRS